MVSRTQTEPHWNLDDPQNAENPLPTGVLAIGAPGFEPGTSPTRTARATRLRHAPTQTAVSHTEHFASNQTVSTPTDRSRTATLAPCPANGKTPSPSWTNSSSLGASRTTAPTASSSPAKAR